MVNHVHNSLVARLFSRFLKDNDLPLNTEAYKKVFFCKHIINVQMLLQDYLPVLRKQKLYSDDNFGIHSVILRLKWLRILIENHIDLNNDKIAYYSPYGMKISFVILDIYSLNDNEIHLKSFLRSRTLINF